MKRKISILFIALATVMALMLGIVPHHHHEGVACMIVEHANHPAGDEAQQEQLCIVESGYTLHISNRTKCKVSSCDHCDNLIHIHFFPILYLAADFLLYPSETVSVKSGEYISFYKSAETSGFHSLRAPPFMLS
jgi:hypothetical protein